ncbi:hypothetical protein PLESTB_001473100 [Pleodorina starrii]|uniref:EngB-type G domain-containing protein n=1 Tax=Pleodorina starrii TaxID=330485 RepID=A0A9W6BW35_9CHLO|nr:hypothetical protein PLESTM_000644500 [Pleodorina starrii]GLC59312.1 hypothetical protein PLESTB_001473100 [Pleodorina starrii]GLC74489.1 hypothetical protein PLESTF_001518200 [Pleodorina starrii]
MFQMATRPLTPQALGLACSRVPPARRVRTAIRLAAGSSDGFQYMQLDLPPPLNSNIRKAEFIKSSTRVADCPPDKLPEFALIGRSNVGKSSLINSLTRNDKLAKVSKEPGMTKLINHYLINDCWYLVDLPGYGFAKAGKSNREEWLTFTKDFFIQRENLVSVLLLVDSSVTPQQVDADCANWLAECEVPFCIVFTKIDNRKRDMPPNAQNVRAFKQLMAAEWEELPRCFETSSRTGAGRSELLGYVASLRELHIRATK